jgi:hypothetical protein
MIDAQRAILLGKLNDLARSRTGKEVWMYSMLSVKLLLDHVYKICKGTIFGRGRVRDEQYVGASLSVPDLPRADAVAGVAVV